MFRKTFRTTCCLILCISFLVNSFISVAAAENRSPVTTATAAYYSPLLRKTLQWDFTYSDQWFTSDPCVYSHPIARASLGMALSAFRVKNNRVDAAIELYLTELGFTDLSSINYNRETSIETISTMIGHKQLPSGETLLAVAICGQGYTT